MLLCDESEYCAGQSEQEQEQESVPALVEAEFPLEAGTFPWE